MNRSGTAIFPHERYQSHSENLQPVRPMVLWAYSDMSDPRWTWGKEYFGLRQDPEMTEPQKIGFLNKRGWAAFARNGILFVKRYATEHGKTYPDFQVNTETFTNGDMLEIETMGALVSVPPGESAEHTEVWELFRREVGSSEAEWKIALADLDG